MMPLKRGKKLSPGSLKGWRAEIFLFIYSNDIVLILLFHMHFQKCSIGLLYSLIFHLTADNATCHCFPKKSRSSGLTLSPALRRHLYFYCCCLSIFAAFLIILFLQLLSFG